MEFAIIAPVLLLMILGAFVFGLQFAQAHSVQHLASESARATVAGLTEQERVDLARRYVQETIASYPLLRSDALTIAARFEPADPDLFTVSLSYDTTAAGTMTLGSLIPLAPERLERSATVRRGGP